jgi:hypothetical protein
MNGVATKVATDARSRRPPATRWRAVERRIRPADLARSASSKAPSTTHCASTAALPSSKQETPPVSITACGPKTGSKPRSEAMCHSRASAGASGIRTRVQGRTPLAGDGDRPRASCAPVRASRAPVRASPAPVTTFFKRSLTDLSGRIHLARTRTEVPATRGFLAQPRVMPPPPAGIEPAHAV